MAKKIIPNTSKRKTKSKPKNKFLYYAKKTVLYFFIGSIGLVIIYRFVPIYYTPLMLIRTIERTVDGKKLVYSRDWEPLENISPNLPLAVMGSEDQKFLDHYGFDFESMLKAFQNNKKGKRIKGGSTISMQVAKNVFLWNGRSYLRKAFEAYFTVLIELFWSKERIMEVYLNVIEMGIGVYGAEAASQYYFNTTAKNLTRNQAAWIACILPNPLKYDPKRPTNYLYGRHQFVKQQMRNLGPIDFNK